MRTIDNFIVRLRRVLEPDPQNPRYIHTVRGTGYRLTP
jgi:two-component system alkaline phosphatase synthesis response regulator PhoP